MNESRMVDRAVRTLGVLSIVIAGASSFAIAQLPPASSSTTPSATATQTPAYVKVQSSSAKLTNLADKGADVLLRPSAGTILRVHAENAGFYEVSAPGGLQVWIFGEFAKPASDPGMVEITANGVRMRPQPSAAEKSFALKQSLAKGDKVRYVARNDPSKAMSEDWIQVTSPSSAHAWIPVADTTPLAATEDGKALFAAAEQQALASATLVEVPRAANDGAAKADAPKTTKPADASASATKPDATAKPANASAQIGDALANADKLYDAARASQRPDWAGVRAAYQKVIDASPSGSAASSARSRLQEVEAREGIEKLKADATKTEAQRQAELAKKQDELREASLYTDPLWGRFQARGWVEQADDRFVVRWANKLTAEIVCTQKRYDLAQFVGYEVGVIGITSRAAVPAAGGNDAKPARIDVSRLEVLSGAGTTR